MGRESCPLLGSWGPRAGKWASTRGSPLIGMYVTCCRTHPIEHDRRRHVYDVVASSNGFVKGAGVGQVSRKEPSGAGRDQGRDSHVYGVATETVGLGYKGTASVVIEPEVVVPLAVWLCCRCAWGCKRGGGRYPHLPQLQERSTVLDLYGTKLTSAAPSVTS